MSDAGIAVLTPATLERPVPAEVQRRIDEPFIPGPPARLFTALAQAQSEFTPVAKTKTAKIRSDKGDFTYKYADLADILMMAQPILARNGLCVTQPIRRVAGLGMLLVTEIHHSSGESLCDDGLPLAAGGSPQAFGSLLTYMRRYGYCTLVGIQADADEDGQLATAEKKDRDELARAQGRNNRALNTNPAPVTNEASASGTSDSAGWDVDQCKDFNTAWKAGGWRKEDAAAYMRDVLAVTALKLAHPGQHSAAIEWAKRGPVDPIKTVAGSSTPASTATAQAAQGAGSGSKPTTLTGPQKASFWDAARKHGKTDADVIRYLDGLGIKSTAEMRVDQLTAALTWATEGPAISEWEKKGRQGMSLLGLDLNQQAELVDAHKGDWQAIAEACSTEISRRDEQQP